ncbi:DNA translocase FtsK [Candidatus Curtissbacteria bacterium]|nr:DNA translocase FtsK [Candidatus Curtissbacteria bacterium]
MPRVKKRKLISPLNLEKKTIKSILGFGLLASAVLLVLSFFSETALLVSIKEYIFNLLGLGIILVPPYALIAALSLFQVKTKIQKTNIIFGTLAACLSILSLVSPFSQSLSGIIATAIWTLIKSFVTPVGAFFILLFTFFVSLIITTNTSISDVSTALSVLRTKLASLFKLLSFSRGPSKRPLIPTTIQNKTGQDKPRNINPDAVLAPSVVVNSPGENRLWQYPPLSLLADAKGGQANRGNLKQNAQTIEKTLESFGISAKVVEVNPGPTVTQYGLEIPMGTKLSKILTLQNDLALALATSNGMVRIEAPIPGKSLVGIEIPNITPETVNLKRVLSTGHLIESKAKTIVGLGEDVSGNIITADLARMPHVLIAGTTGSGKSVLLNAIISTILFRASPQEVKLILADPKRVELTEYKDIPHLLTPVIIEPDKILSSLRWAESEMDRRYKLFHDAQVKNIAGYNEFSGFQALPYIVIVIDELHNLMEFAPVEVEDSICRLAAMARATGIHLVVATQRPSVDVITGLIKANIPCRIAFNVSSMIDSRVIIDSPGAEKLLGKGDMLYVPPDASKPQRIQGVYVSDTEIRNLIGFLRSSGFAPEYTDEVIQMPTSRISGGHGGASGEKDDLFEEAVRTICQYDRASASLLQRRLRIGYARAARLIDELEMAGIIGPGEGAKPRDVLVKNAEEYLQSQQVEAPQQ